MQLIRPTPDRRSFLKYALTGYAAVKASTASTTASGAVGALATERYNDVKTGDRFLDAVNFVTDRGLIDGLGANFNPVANADRATVATALYLIAGSPPVTYSPIFPDVPADRWYLNAVIWAEETEVITGYGDGRFGTDDAVTRQQFVSMLLRAARIKFPEAAALDGFTDKGGVNESARTALGWCVKRGLTADTSSVNLEPNSNVSRAQCASVLQRFVNLKENPLNIRPENAPTAGVCPWRGVHRPGREHARRMEQRFLAACFNGRSGRQGTILSQPQAHQLHRRPEPDAHERLAEMDGVSR